MYSDLRQIAWLPWIHRFIGFLLAVMLLPLGCGFEDWDNRPNQDPIVQVKVRVGDKVYEGPVMQGMGGHPLLVGPRQCHIRRRGRGGAAWHDDRASRGRRGSGCRRSAAEGGA